MSESQAMAAEAVREEEAAVFTARLWYSCFGTPVELKMLPGRHFELIVENHRVFSYKTLPPANFVALRITSGLEHEEEDGNGIDFFVFCPELPEDGTQASFTDTLNIAEKHLCRVPENAALYIKMEGDTYWPLGMLKMEKDKQLLIHKVLAAYECVVQATSKAAPESRATAALQLALSSPKYHHAMDCSERAIAIGKQALEETGPELALQLFEDRTEKVGFIDKINMKPWSDIKSKDPDSNFEACFNTAPKGWSPPPVPHSVRAEPPMHFISPGDWGYQVGEGRSLREMRSRKKAAQTRGLNIMD